MATLRNLDFPSLLFLKKCVYHLYEQHPYIDEKRRAFNENESTYLFFYNESYWRKTCMFESFEERNQITKFIWHILALSNCKRSWALKQKKNLAKIISCIWLQSKVCIRWDINKTIENKDVDIFLRSE